MTQAITQTANIVEAELTDGCKIFVPEIDPIAEEVERWREEVEWLSGEKYPRIVRREHSRDLTLMLHITLRGRISDNFWVTTNKAGCLIQTTACKKNDYIIKPTKITQKGAKELINECRKVRSIRTILAICIYAKEHNCYMCMSHINQIINKFGRNTRGVFMDNIDFDWSTKQEYTYKSLIQPILDEISAIDKSLG